MRKYGTLARRKAADQAVLNVTCMPARVFLRTRGRNRVRKRRSCPRSLRGLAILHLPFEAGAERLEIRLQKPDVSIRYAEMGNLPSLDPKIHRLRAHAKKLRGLADGQAREDP